MSGQELFNVIIQHTGLPEEYVRARFERLIVDHGGSINDLSLESVRELLADLMLELISESHQEPI